MSTDLMQRLADYRADLDSAIETHRAATLVETVESPRPPRRRLVLAVAAVALLAGGIGLVVAVNRDDSSRESVSGFDDTTGVTTLVSVAETTPVPSTTTVSDTTWDWLDQFGAEVPQPPIPDGWKVLDFEAFRFAVPADWVVPSALTCSLPAPGFVLIAASEPTMCASGEPPPPSVLSILPAADAGTPGTPVTIGTLSATELPPKCAGCAPVYLFDIPYQLSVSGPEAEQVLGTFTNSGFQRVLQAGDEADTAGWRTVTYKGVAFRVPSQWAVVNNESNSSDPAGPVSLQVDPGICGGPMFPSVLDPQVSLGTSRLIPSCAPQINFDLEPGDGLWVRSTADSLSQPDGTQIGHGVVDGLDVTVVAMHRTQAGAPTPTVDLVVRDGSATPIWVSLGVGTDTSIARSILRSLHAVRDGP
jgi:hypothetical protein